MGSLAPAEPIEEEVIEHHFSLGYPAEAPFPIELHWPRGGYSLRTIESGEVICKDVNYVKTFGGAFGGITVHLIANRFVAYPETVDDVDGDPIFNDHMAVTHVYDLLKKKRVYTSGRYRYNHDIHHLIYKKASIPGYTAP